jgi:hypothetical protein
MSRPSDDQDLETRRRRERDDRPDPAGQYGSLDDRLGYGGGRDPGNLSEHGRDATTHNHREGDRRDEHGWESGSREPEADAKDRPGAAGEGDPRR